MQEIHWSDDVAHHKNKAGHCRLSRNLSIRNGETTNGSQVTLCQLMAVLVDHRRLCYVHLTSSQSLELYFEEETVEGAVAASLFY